MTTEQAAQVTEGIALAARQARSLALDGLAIVEDAALQLRLLLADVSADLDGLMALGLSCLRIADSARALGEAAELLAQAGPSEPAAPIDEAAAGGGSRGGSSRSGLVRVEVCEEDCSRTGSSGNRKG